MSLWIFPFGQDDKKVASRDSGSVAGMTVVFLLWLCAEIPAFAGMTGEKAGMTIVLVWNDGCF